MNVRTNRHRSVRSRTPRRRWQAAVLLLHAAGYAAHAGPTEQAKRIYERIAGEPPSPAVLTQMANAITASRGQPAARHRAGRRPPMRRTQRRARSFYNVTLKNMVIPWTNRDQTVFAPLNDYAATVIGMVRDDVTFNTALSADILYTVNAGGPAGALDRQQRSLRDRRDQRRRPEHRAQARPRSRRPTASPTAATAGLITTRGAASAFFINGTNRAMFRFTMINHLCHDMETGDGHHAPDRIASARTWRARPAATAASS